VIGDNLRLESVPVLPLETDTPLNFETMTSPMTGPRSLLLLGILVLCQACSLSDHHVVQSNLGKPSSLVEMERLIDKPGPIEVETINSADWTVPLAGLLNLKSMAAREAHLADHPEPIHIFAHVVRHPQFGTYLVDTGVSKRLLDDPGGHYVSWVVRKVMPLDKIEIRDSTAQILAGIPAGVQGVFFTHLHVDHISGMPDIPRTVPLYVGLRPRSRMLLFEAPPLDCSMERRIFRNGRSGSIRRTKVSLSGMSWTYSGMGPHLPSACPAIRRAARPMFYAPLRARSCSLATRAIRAGVGNTAWNQVLTRLTNRRTARACCCSRSWRGAILLWTYG
jgi:hypothetical protein